MSLRSNKIAKKRNLVSVFFTLAIITALFIAGPVSAVNLQLKTDRTVYEQEDPIVTFTTSVDIQNKEVVPIQSLKLIINDGFRVCEFSPDGTSSCPHMTITVLDDGSVQTTDDMNGKGFGFVNSGDPLGNTATDFGYGYGFEDEVGKSGLRGELRYEIRWNVATDAVPNGKYTAELQAFAENGNQYTYISKSPTSFRVEREDPIIIIPPAPKNNTIVNFAEVESRTGHIDYVGNDSSFAKEDLLFSADLRRVKLDNNETVHGRTTFTLHGESANKTVNLKLDLYDSNVDLINFIISDIHINGMADFEYTKTEVGKAPIRTRGRMNNIDIQVTAGQVFVRGNDQIPFSADFFVERFNFR